jgi:hypothetical protein
MEEALRRGDLDELVRVVDALCDARDWAALENLRDRCARAHETGRQLWPAAAHAAYRLALEAPGPWASAVLVDDPAPFTLGPLSEVAAQSHEWAELAPHVPRGAAAVLTAHERVLRGEDLATIELPGPAVLELPLALAPWEPAYALAAYHPHDAEFPMPAIPRRHEVRLPAPPEHAEDEACTALIELVRPWTTGSNGRAEAVMVHGDALAAIAALGVTRTRVAEIDLPVALAWLAWAGASGGAHGRRAGAAAGRFGAWWALGAVVALLDEWPPDEDRLGSELERLRFLAWEAEEADTGWRLHLAIEDPKEGRSWAVAAVDAD